MAASGLPEWMASALIELYEIIEDPNDTLLSVPTDDLQNLLSPFSSEAPLRPIRQVVEDFFAGMSCLFC